jgi:D-glutamate cyclase
MAAEKTIHKIQGIIGTDIGNRGMKALVCPGDLWQASQTLAHLKIDASKNIIILSGFPCLVHETPPTETDGPPGALAIARACVALGHSNVIIVTDDCNAKVFGACLRDLALPVNTGSTRTTKTTAVPQLQSFPANMSEHDNERMAKLAKDCALYIACERAGPGADGVCYTMKGIDMNDKGLIAPLEKFVVEYRNAPQQQQQQPEQDHHRHRPLFIAIGDGGNELGMGKVIDRIIDNPQIRNGDKIGCVVAADYLIAASISNWGGYALAAGAAVCRAAQESSSISLSSSISISSSSIKDWVNNCLPTEEEEVALLNRGVAAGIRDGISGKMEATVDGFPLATSLQVLRDIRTVALATGE